MTDYKKIDENSYAAGRRSALIMVMHMALKELGYPVSKFMSFLEGEPAEKPTPLKKPIARIFYDGEETSLFIRGVKVRSWYGEDMSEEPHAIARKLREVINNDIKDGIVYE